MNIDLIKFLTTLKTPQLYNLLVKVLHKNGYDTIERQPHFIMAEGLDPICLIAHMDTVFSFQPALDDFFYDTEKQVLWSPYGSGFDDRAGIAAIIEIINRGYRPHIIFTDLEEAGGVGARELVKEYPYCPFKDCNALIQLDRANENDAVYYDCNNKKFEEFITKHGFETDIGTFSDISIIAPEWRIAAANLSVGYLDEHSSSERLHFNWLNATIDKVTNIIEDISSEEKFKYIKVKYIPLYYKYNFDTCILCGKHLDPKSRYEIYDTDFPYAVCPSCYNKYYNGEEDMPFN